MKHRLFRNYKHYDLSNYTVRYIKQTVEFIEKYSDEVDYVHDLAENPLDMMVEGGVLIIGEMEENETGTSSMKQEASKALMRFEESKGKYLYLIAREKVSHGFVDYGFSLTRIPVRIEQVGNSIKLTWPITRGEDK